LSPASIKEPGPNYRRDLIVVMAMRELGHPPPPMRELGHPLGQDSGGVGQDSGRLRQRGGPVQVSELF